MTFPRHGTTAALEELLGYGTSEGVKKSWEHRRRAQPRSNIQSLTTKEGLLNVNALSKVGNAMGSNPGGVYQAPDGTQFYVKQYETADHARNEVLATKLYEAAGARVPQVGLGELNGNVVIASKMISGLTLMKNQSGAAQAFKMAGAQDDFAADCWLVNWDTVGMEMDNMAIQSNGKIIRMDAGGALRYRAQGGEKPAMKTEVTELETMRQEVPGFHSNPQAHSVFGDISPEKLRASMKKVVDVPASTIRHLVLKYGPKNETKNQALMDGLLARQEYIRAKYKSMGGI